jgi:hypothetical protein
VTPLAILLERADAAVLAHGAAAQEELLRQIRSAIRNGESQDRVRDLDHVLQLVEYRERVTRERPEGPALHWPLGGPGTPPRSAVAPVGA